MPVPPKIAASTVAELGGLLPWDMIVWRNIDKEWRVQFQAHGLTDKDVESFRPGAEADARAEMLIYLIENKLIEFEEGA
jgi:hypothetical protein